ncbi:unnamed protein product [Scytosiphon promiscuus]
MLPSKASKRVRNGDLRPSELTEACINQMERSSWLNCFVVKCPDAARLEAEAADARQANGSLVGPLDGIPYAAKDNFCTLGVQTTASSAALAGFTPPYDSTPTHRLRQAGSPLVGKTNMDEFGMGSGTLFSEFGRTFNPWSPVERPPTDGDHGDHVRGEGFVVPGGSSGGSAAAVASGSCFAALGSDTGGSVRQPAAFCGVVGLKPTYGLIPRHGLIAYASSLDTPGVIARSVMDSAMVLDVIAGHDSRDSTCVPAGSSSSSGGGGSFASNLLEASLAAAESSWPLKGVTVGIPREFNVEELDAGVREAWEHTTRVAAYLGAEVVEVSMPSVPQALAAYAVLASAEASSNLSRYDGLRYGARAADPAASGGTAGAAGGGGMFRDQGELHAEITRTRTAYFGDEVKRRILTGCFVLCESAYHDYYELAIETQRRLRREMRAALSIADVLLAPTTPFPPFASAAPADPASLLLNDVLTVPISLTGVPAISIPVATTPLARDVTSAERCSGRGANGGGDGGAGTRDENAASQGGELCRLPLGMQVVGRPLGERAMLRVAHALEDRLGFASQVPARVWESRPTTQHA